MSSLQTNLNHHHLLRHLSIPYHGGIPHTLILFNNYNIVSRSSIEDDYRAMTPITIEIVWSCWLSYDMSVPCFEPTPMYCDDKTTIQISHNLVFYERIKHIEMDGHFTCPYLPRGTITTIYLFLLVGYWFIHGNAFHTIFLFLNWQTLNAPYKCIVGFKEDVR